MFTLFIIILLCSGISGMISERDQRRYEMYKKQKEAKEKQEAKETKRKDYDPMSHLYCMEQEFGIKFTNIPGTANKETQDSIKNVSKIIDEATNAEKKMKELKEKQEKVLQRKKELEQLINDRMGKQITMDEWEKEIDKQNIIKEIKEQKEKEALNNGGIQISLFENENKIEVTDEEVREYKKQEHENFMKNLESPDDFVKRMEERRAEIQELKERINKLLSKKTIVNEIEDLDI